MWDDLIVQPDRKVIEVLARAREQFHVTAIGAFRQKELQRESRFGPGPAMSALFARPDRVPAETRHRGRQIHCNRLVAAPEKDRSRIGWRRVRRDAWRFGRSSRQEAPRQR